jgi:hypothetical protein
VTAPPLLVIAAGRRARPRKAPAPKQSELHLHIAIADVLRRFCRPDWRWWHTPNGEQRDVRVAAKLKAMGVKPGIADLLLLASDGRLHCLELKTANGRLSEAQEDFRVFCIKSGIPFVVARRVEDALLAFELWGCLTPRIGGAA